MTDDDRGVLTLHPVGFARTPHAEKADAPRQPLAAVGVAGRLEILPTYRDALSDLEGFERLIVIFGFDRAPRTASLKVQPPRSTTKRGVFATRSPHRPNPIGLSIVRLVRIEDLTLHVSDVDLLDGTPIYDLKPYLAYTDAFPAARAGWLEDEEASAKRSEGGETPTDPRGAYAVTFGEAASEACTFVETETGLALERRAREHLALGPQPHAYRRIRKEGDASVLSVKDWRVVFVVRQDGRSIDVTRVRSGYSERELERENDGRPERDVHRRFVERFGR